jgi:hypothetical protein
MLRFARFWLFAGSLISVGGCRDRGIIDDFGTSGYARIEGTVTLADATPLASGGVAFSCGPESPTAFGWSVPTDETGHYVIDIDSPGPVTVPASGAMSCRVSAPSNAPPIVSVDKSVRFSTSADARPLTIVDLRAP